MLVHAASRVHDDSCAVHCAARLIWGGDLVTSHRSAAGTRTDICERFEFCGQLFGELVLNSVYPAKFDSISAEIESENALGSWIESGSVSV